MEGSPEIVGIGASTLDHFFVVDSFPAGEGVQEAERCFSMGGGPVATALATAAALGSRTLLCDHMGDDDAAAAVIGQLSAHGVDTSGIARQPGTRSSEASVLVRRSDGARAIAFARQTATELAPADLPEEAIRGARLLHLNGRHPEAALAAAGWIHEAGGLVSFDGGAGRYRASLDRQLAETDILVVAADFARAWSGHDNPEDALRWMRDSGVREITGITDGAAGSWFSERGGPLWHQPASPVRPDHIVDTTGCGDVFHGAFLHALCGGYSTGKCAALAARIAANNARGLGGRWCLGPTAPPLHIDTPKP